MKALSILSPKEVDVGTSTVIRVLTENPTAADQIDLICQAHWDTVETKEEYLARCAQIWDKTEELKEKSEGWYSHSFD